MIRTRCAEFFKFQQKIDFIRIFNLVFFSPQFTLMRTLCILLFLALFQTANGQDFCKQMIKDVSSDKKSIELSSPTGDQEVPAVKVQRSINTDPDFESDNFFIVFRLTGDLESIYTKAPEGDQIEKEELKLVVEFDDKSKLVDDTVKVSHDFTNDKMLAIRYVYLPLTEATVKDFTTKKIVKFSLAGYEKTIPADEANAMMHYVECAKKLK